MEFDRSRLRSGEWIVGAGALVLLASTFLFKWHALSNLRWLIILTALCGLAVFFSQATRRAPALPVSLTVIVTVLGLLSTVALIYRVLIDEPGGYSHITQRFGAFAGMLSAIVIVIGGYRSLREDGIATADAPSEIETVRLGTRG